MSKQSYSDKLKDPRWQRKRLAILNRSDFSCEDCGVKDKTLHVHHCIYYSGREPWEYEDYELRSLCEPCHSERAFVEKDGVEEFRRFMARHSRKEINSIINSFCCFAAYEGQEPMEKEMLKWFADYAESFAEPNL